LARNGHVTAVLDSITLEEANSDPINWLRQRSRWYKGYLQTFLVHVRQPVLVWHQLGWSGYARFAGVTAGTPLTAVANAAFWLLTLVWFLGQPSIIRSLFPTPIYLAAMLSLIVGNATIIYLGVLTARAERKPYLAIASLLVPLYWVLMSIAAIKGIIQLIFNPSYWEKTVHGLDHRANEVSSST